MSAALLQLDGVAKSFAGVRALKPVSLELRAGEVLGLVGENGAGKSTLIKILSGVHAPDAGTIRWGGQPARFATPHDAQAAGIATIHQELAYFAHLTVAENLLLGEPWPRHRWGGVDWRALHREAAARLARFGLDVPAARSFHQLGAAQKQEVAIVRALCQRARLLILDEPTASLSEPEVERLFAQVTRLRAEGVAVLYVSHRLDEILRLTDRVVVLRDGELVATHVTRETDVRALVRDMVGRPLDQVYPHTRPDRRGEPLLELTGATRAGMFRDVHLTVRAGEIVGLAGLVGAGRSELARAIYGLYPLEGGAMRLGGQPWKPAAAHDALAAGLVYLPEERKRQGLVPDHSVGDSLSIGFSDLLTRCGFIRRDAEQAKIASAMKTCAVRAASPAQAVGTLSGGNQQKVLLARWLERGPRVILLDEPTRGVDVGAKAEIHALIDRLAGAGKAVLMISSDLPEVLGMSDRVLVMHRGTISAELTGGDRTQEKVILAASGLLN
jgi:ABC-type sugar transport system ATPase subunit